MAKDKKDKKRFADHVNIRNRKAKYEYSFLEEMKAGMQLKGTEIKSIREGKVNMEDAFCYFSNGELFVKQMQIAPYAQGTYHNHER